MANGWTNKGKKRILDIALRGLNVPTKFRVILCTAAATPTADINTVSELTEIAAGNGYTSGGLDVERSATGWPTLTEDDTNDLAKCVHKALTWTPAGGSIPASGGAIRWAVLIDDNATLGSAEVLAYFDPNNSLTFADGQAFTFQNGELRLTE